mgnify:CR=1 FL=1
MIQDYFSLDKKGNDYLLLRIINKVDFEEEVVWARDFSLSDRTGISKPVEQLMSYLKSGLDSLSDWNGDMEGFHSSIQHFGFENLLRTDNLIPAFILREDAKMPEINLLIFNELKEKRWDVRSLRRRSASFMRHFLPSAQSHTNPKTRKPPFRFL